MGITEKNLKIRGKKSRSWPHRML